MFLHAPVLICAIGVFTGYASSAITRLTECLDTTLTGEDFSLIASVSGFPFCRMLRCIVVPGRTLRLHTSCCD
jgi:hypothetical protein